MKKFVLSLGSVAAVVAPVASVISCGDETETMTVTLGTHKVAGSKIDAIFEASSTARFGDIESVSAERDGDNVTYTFSAKITTAGNVVRMVAVNTETTAAKLNEVWKFSFVMSATSSAMPKKISISSPIQTTVYNANKDTAGKVTDLASAVAMASAAVQNGGTGTGTGGSGSTGGTGTSTGGTGTGTTTVSATVHHFAANTAFNPGFHVGDSGTSKAYPRTTIEFTGTALQALLGEAKKIKSTVTDVPTLDTAGLLDAVETAIRAKVPTFGNTAFAAEEQRLQAQTAPQSQITVGTFKVNSADAADSVVAIGINGISQADAIRLVKEAQVATPNDKLLALIVTMI